MAIRSQCCKDMSCPLCNYRSKTCQVILWHLTNSLFPSSPHLMVLISIDSPSLNQLLNWGLQNGHFLILLYIYGTEIFFSPLSFLLRILRASPVLRGKKSTCSAREHGLGQEDPLGEGMAAHSSILTWRIPWTEELGGLWSIGLQRVGHN